MAHVRCNPYVSLIWERNALDETNEFHWKVPINHGGALLRTRLRRATFALHEMMHFLFMVGLPRRSFTKYMYFVKRKLVEAGDF